jgi:hypothetical protein
MEMRRSESYKHIDNKSKKRISPYRRCYSDLPLNRLAPCGESTSEDSTSSKQIFYSKKVLEKLMKISGVSDNRSKQYSSFVNDILRCSQEYYPELLLQPDNISKAYEMYMIGRGWSKLDFTVLGRVPIMKEEECYLSNEKFPFIDSALRRNLLGHDSREKSRIILRISDEEWNIVKNISWILGLIHASAQFNFASRIVEDNLWDCKAERIRPFAAEIKALTSSGYELHKTQLEVVAVCIDKKKAQKATLRALIEAMQSLSNYDRLKEFYRSLPDEVKGEK